MEYTLKQLGQTKKIFQIVFLIALIILGLYTRTIAIGYCVFFVFGILHMSYSYFKNKGKITITDDLLSLKLSKESHEFDFQKIRKIKIVSESNWMIKRDLLYVENSCDCQIFTINRYDVDSLASILIEQCQKYDIEYDRSYSKL